MKSVPLWYHLLVNDVWVNYKLVPNTLLWAIYLVQCCWILRWYWRLANDIKSRLIIDAKHPDSALKKHKFLIYQASTLIGESLRWWRWAEKLHLHSPNTAYYLWFRSLVLTGTILWTQPPLSYFCNAQIMRPSSAALAAKMSDHLIVKI